MFRRFLSEQKGAAMVEFTIVMTVLFALTLGFVDFGHAFYQWNAAGKAVQVGARLAAVSAPIPTGLVAESSTTDTALVGETLPEDHFRYVCTADTTGLAACSRCALDGSCAVAAASQSAFDLVFDGDGSRPGMQDFFPALEKDNVQIEYVATGLGYWTRPGGPIPTIRVSVQNVQFQFFFLSGLMGFDSITMPPMLSTITGQDLCTAGTTC